jgi:hypothetical protein
MKAVLAQMPVSISLNLSDGATLSGIKVALNGEDITSRFSANSSGVAAASVNRDIYFGGNALKVTFGTQIVRSSFTYDPGRTTASSGGLGTSGPPPPDVVPIQTRARITANGKTVWGIQVDQTAYPDPNGYAGGFQILLLKRTDLSLVSNASYNLTSAADVEIFVAAITAQYAANQAACGPAACLMIIQSLDTVGFDPCNNPAAILCSVYGNTFAALGGSATLGISTPDSAGLGYSLIANVGTTVLHPGSFFERVTCSTSDGCISPNLQAINNRNITFLNGLAPNTADGIVTSLINTGAAGTTTLPSTSPTPGLVVSNNGAIGGELLRDNNGYYTFSYAAAPIHFVIGVALDDPNKNLLTLTLPPGSANTFADGSRTIAGESSQLPAGATGGFRLVAFDAVTFKNLANSTYVIDPRTCPLKPNTNYCISPDGTAIYHLDQLRQDILTFNSRAYILFVASIGDLSHDISLTDPTTGIAYNMQDVWDRVAQSIQDIGGTFVTFDSLNNPAFAGDTYDQYIPSGFSVKNSIPQDDYVLIGQWWLNDSQVPNPYAVEESTQISRQVARYPVPSNVEGTLEMENDGYYRAKMHTKYGGLLPNVAFTLTSAPLMYPTSWPYDESNGTTAEQAAYQWISQQLLGCVAGCTNIHSAYTNLNQSPSTWLALLSGLDIPDDCEPLPNPDCPVGFNENDFENVKGQLLAEIQYLSVLRQYQSNVLGLLQAEQANISVILQQTTDEVLGNIDYTNTSSSYGISDWRSDVEESLNLIGDISGFASLVPFGSIASDGIKVAIGVTDFGLSASAKHTNDPNGRPLIEQAHDQVVASGLAQKAADQYAQTLTSVGVDFNRIASDWGRLSAVGGSLVNNQLTWNAAASGYLLKGFNSSIRRSFYKSLLASGYWAVHYRYAAPGIHPNQVAGYYLYPASAQCKYYEDLPTLLTQNPDSYAYIPGTLIDGPGSSLQSSLSLGNRADLYPYDVWWDVWVLQQNTRDATCGTKNAGSSLPTKTFYDTTGLFRPLDPANPTPLGFYKPWFYQRSGIPVNKQITPAYNYWYDNTADGYPPFNASDNWYPDPDNY